MVSTGSLSYERAIGGKTSVMLTGAYTAASAFDVSITGFVISPEFRWYPGNKKEAPAGYFISPFLRYQSLELAEGSGLTQAKGTFSSFGGGLITGWQWIIGSGFVVDLWGGVMYNAGDVKVTQGTSTIGSTGFSGAFPRVGLSIGWAF